MKHVIAGSGSAGAISRLTRRFPRMIRHRICNDIINLLFLLPAFVFVSCASPTQSTSPQTITAYATSSAEPWLGDLFACANERAITVNVTVTEPDIYLRIGEPENLLLPAFQIDEEELLIVTHRESPVQSLSLEEVRALFAGQDDPAVQVWVYPSELDIFGLFDQFVMQGRSVTSFARVAPSVEALSDAVNSESNAVGIIPSRWGAGSAREVYSVGVFPVLAITREEPQGAVRDLISCLRK